MQSSAEPPFTSNGGSVLKFESSGGGKLHFINPIFLTNRCCRTHIKTCQRVEEKNIERSSPQCPFETRTLEPPMRKTLSSEMIRPFRHHSRSLSKCFIFHTKSYCMLQEISLVCKRNRKCFTGTYKISYKMSPIRNGTQEIGKSIMFISQIHMKPPRQKTSR